MRARENTSPTVTTLLPTAARNLETKQNTHTAQQGVGLQRQSQSSSSDHADAVTEAIEEAPTGGPVDRATASGTELPRERFGRFRVVCSTTASIPEGAAPCGCDDTTEGRATDTDRFAFSFLATVRGFF